MTVSFRSAVVLGALSGFIALAYEIIWARVYNFVSGSNAQAFGMLLGSYLLGLALGSLWSQRWQEVDQLKKPGLRTLARIIVLSNLAAYSVVPVVSWMVTRFEWPQTLPVVIAGAALLGAVFPLLCHFAISPDSRCGSRLSLLYLSNIVGSGLGSLLTGLLFMDWFPLWMIAASLLILAAGTSMVITRALGTPTFADRVLWAATLGAACMAPLLFSHLYERLQYKRDYCGASLFVDVEESRHGVITVDQERRIFGNGVYDGMLDTGANTGGGLFRPYFLSAVDPTPSDVLVIGVSGGAWTKVLAHNPMVKTVTAIEIDSGYLRVIKRHSEVADLLTDPKVRIVVDDGRRWLRRNPERLFDAIVMNSTINWREFASALIGREFLVIARGHLRPGGVIMWNCTASERAFHTGLTVFPYTITLANFCIGSMSPLTVDPVRWREVLSAYRMDGRPVFDRKTPEGRASLEGMLEIATDPKVRAKLILDRAQMEQKYGPAEIITDDNLGNEYKFTLKNVQRIKKLLFF